MDDCKARLKVDGDADLDAIRKIRVITRSLSAQTADRVLRFVLAEVPDDFARYRGMLGIAAGDVLNKPKTGR